MQASARIGFSRLLARYALIANSIPAADEAVRLSPSDAHTHRTRAVVLTRLQQPAEAVKSLEAATSLRYRDDYLWLDLGNAREEVGDTIGALDAFDQAVHWAPYYAHTHWQRGNLLLRMGRTSEAFSELRRAADSNKRYLPNLIDLAFGISGQDVRTTEQLTQIRDDDERLGFMQFLARKGKGKDVANQALLLKTPLDSKHIDELARLLYEARAFSDAYTVWTRIEPAKSLQRGLFNGGFEEELLLNSSAFGGWILSPEKNSNRLAIDISEKFTGTRSLQINFGGNWNPGTALLSQTVLVEPLKTYRVSFSVKTKDLVTGGAPLFMVNDATNNQLLGKSENVPSTSSWLTLSFDFTTLATSEAAVIRFQRNNCDQSPCPIFGVLWLDEIAIEQTNATAPK